jgi:hypothetical protein
MGRVAQVILSFNSSSMSTALNGDVHISHASVPPANFAAAADSIKIARISAAGPNKAVDAEIIDSSF